MASRLRREEIVTIQVLSQKQVPSRAIARPSVITSNPASHGHFKSGQSEGVSRTCRCLPRGLRFVQVLGEFCAPAPRAALEDVGVV